MDSELDTPKRPRGRPPIPLFPKPKRPRGRPAKDIDDKKHIRLTVRLNQAEHDLWQRLAHEEGVPLVDFINTPIRNILRNRGSKS